MADTLRCLESLRRQRVPPARVIVVDNASRQDPGEIATRFPDCVLLRRRTNGGWAGGNNTGIRDALRAGCRLVALLNNDTVVAPNLCERLTVAAEGRREFGVFGPLIYSLERPEELMTAGCFFNRQENPGFFQHQDVPVQIADPPVIRPTDVVNGCCLVARADVFRRVGLIDERFFLVHEESDFCLRARRAGYRCGILAEPLVWHKGSTTFRQEGLHLQRYYDARNLLRLLRKHPSRPGARPTGRAHWEYLRYVYYRYAIERESGRELAAQGVLEGLYDAMTGRYGQFPVGRRPGLVLLKQLFEWWRRRRSRAKSG